ncbi:MAG: accessory Sec system protein Asp3 [Lactobacillus sp.]|jgi:accessory secretory protein Asp3|nr:MAG: accessory Sec system protein Asp3 [Lactobacillus sp.]
MGSLYLTRWPDNFDDVEITGTTVQYLDSGEVLFANEMFSPGMQLCKWRSRVNYLDQGIKPTLPLLEVGKEYTVLAVLTADRTPAVQLRITFFDVNGEKLKMISSTTLSKAFVFPEGAVSYEVALVNLNHTWIKFQYLMIKTTEDARQVTARLDRTSGWIAVQADETIGMDEQSAVLQISYGSRTTMAIPSATNQPSLLVRAYVDDANVMKMLTDIRQTLAHTHFTQVKYLPGQRERFSPEIRAQVDELAAHLLIEEN